MSIWKSLLTSAAVAAALMAAPAQAQDKTRIALVVKALGIGFFEAAAQGRARRPPRSSAMSS